MTVEILMSMVDEAQDQFSNLCAMFPEIDLVFIEFIHKENQQNLPKTLEVLLKFQKFVDQRRQQADLPPPYTDDFIKKRYMNYKPGQKNNQPKAVSLINNNSSVAVQPIIAPPPPPRQPNKKIPNNQKNKRNKMEIKLRHKTLLPVPINSPKSPRKTEINNRSDWQTFDD